MPHWLVKLTPKGAAFWFPPVESLRSLRRQLTLGVSRL